MYVYMCTYISLSLYIYICISLYTYIYIHIAMNESLACRGTRTNI